MIFLKLRLPRLVNFPEKLQGDGTSCAVIGKNLSLPNSDEQHPCIVTSH